MSATPTKPRRSKRSLWLLVVLPWLAGLTTYGVARWVGGAGLGAAVGGIIVGIVFGAPLVFAEYRFAVPRDVLSDERYDPIYRHAGFLTGAVAMAALAAAELYGVAQGRWPTPYSWLLVVVGLTWFGGLIWYGSRT
jgi:hypothetical protein